MKLRPSVQWFAEKMEAALQKNDHKGGWDECSPLWLISKLNEETGEVGEILTRLYLPDGSFNLMANHGDLALVVKECADAANVLHMIADLCRPPDESMSKSTGTHPSMKER